MGKLIYFWEFFKVGLFAIGGGMATIPFLTEISRKFGWFTEEELLNFIAVSESTPGPIGINISTYAGYTAGGGGLSGLLMGVLCTLSLVLPSFLCVVLIARVLEKFKQNSIVKGVFYGIRPATTGLITAAFLGTFIKVFVDTGAIKVFADVFGAIDFVKVGLFFVILGANMIFKKLHPIVFIAFGAVAGLVLGL